MVESVRVLFLCKLLKYTATLGFTIFTKIRDQFYDKFNIGSGQSNSLCHGGTNMGYLRGSQEKRKNK